ncbi:MAG: hypothetical protein ABR563_06500 [Pyrinomonadaceae bacterium]
MRAAELITAYLAAAAPFAVVSFLRRRAHERLTRAAPRDMLARDVTRATLAGLLFPLALAARALARAGDASLAASSSSVVPSSSAAAHDAKFDAARKSLVAALHGFEDRAREPVAHSPDPASRHAESSARRAAADAAHALESLVERYDGLTLALAETDAEGAPAEHETELARVAGRAGDDLVIAGRCVRRRNLSRLREHQSQSRLEMLHALAALQDSLALDDAAHVSSRMSASASPQHAAASQHLSAALLRIYERAFDLFMLHEDARGVQSLTRLLDATRARLYRRHEPDDARAPRAAATGGATCKPRNSQTSSALLDPQSAPPPRASKLTPATRTSQTPTPRPPQPSPRAA